MRKRLLAIWLTIMVLGLGVSSVAGTVYLEPGYIDGTLSVTNMVGTEQVIAGCVDAYSLEGGFEGHDYTAYGGNYHVTVEGGHDYKVFSEVRIKAVAPDESYQYTSTATIGSQITHVAIDETVAGFDFVLDNYGRIEPRVTVLGGDVTHMRFYVATNLEIPPNKYHTAIHQIDALSGFLNDVQTTFPMRPWLTIDANGDGIINPLNEDYVSIYGYVNVDDVQYQLPSQYIDVFQGQTTIVEWTLDLSSSIHGNVVIQGEDFTSYRLYGYAYIDNTWVTFDREFYPVDGHDMNLFPETWDIYPYVRWKYSTNNLNTLRLPSKIVTLESEQRTEVNWNINPGYVGGSIDLFGAHGNLYMNRVYGTTFEGPYAVSLRTSSDYRLIVNPGTWSIGQWWTYLFFNYDKPYLRSELRMQDFGSPEIVVGPGTDSEVDLSYGTATITVNYRVILPENEYGYLQSPYLIATSSEGTGPNRIDSITKGWGSPMLTDLGECTITVLPGTHTIEAYATVDGSFTKFGEFTITVETGDVVTQDVEAPTVHVTQPGGSEHVCGSSVDVMGTATDESGVASVTVNGDPVDFTSTNNPDDVNEVAFSTVVENLVAGEWNIITIEVEDTQDNIITVERQVFRDICNSPPVIEQINGPLDPVAVGNAVDMSAIFTDPDIDDYHTAVWDWGDGTTADPGIVDQTARTVTGSHVYATPGVYTVTLTVTDSWGESDTEVWSQYIVIYDPSAGFVTGGGWIDSPSGAYTEDPSLTGKANFGFVSKYKKGTDVPMGTTEFQFHAGDLNFHSDSYDWLLIAGAKAMFKGTGTINGEGSYKFMVMAVDGTLSDDGTCDTFRIKIWTEDETTGEET
ncbi:MAG: PKD domain-containing protein, partial [Candidatus Thorarchaeota archaeon]